MTTRCPWAGGDPLLAEYHDREWGVPCHDERRLFEFLILEGAQAGLSWLTILKKRGAYRAAFEGFHPERVARFGPRKIRSLLSDPGIVRNRLKVEAAVANARAFLETAKEFGSFDAYIWRFVEGKPRHNSWENPGDVPAQTPLSETISRELKKRGFRFVGPTIVYSFMQAVGMVNDHLLDCARRRELEASARPAAL
ncbi:MAG: DNA-3-methyladenine glycosylase I [Acidobacteriota bacterium]|jgi:DNA-3-methyladenine glycosylase I